MLLYYYINYGELDVIGYLFNHGNILVLLS
jgi:hypothetical protein